MKRYLIRRLLISAVTLLSILIILFLMLQLMPGSPFNDQKLSADQIAILKEKYGLDQPVPVRLVRYIKRMLCGDLGVSYNLSVNTPVTELIKSPAITVITGIRELRST